MGSGVSPQNVTPLGLRILKNYVFYALIALWADNKPSFSLASTISSLMISVTMRFCCFANRNSGNIMVPIVLFYIKIF